MTDDRFQKMAVDYDLMAPIMVPYYSLLQDVMLDYLKIEQAKNPVIVDLGAGSGIFLERVLMRNPGARCVYVDLSQPFMEIARHRLDRFSDNVQFLLADLEDGWSDKLPEKPDYIFSMSAIHHLESHAKQQLYKRCYRLLNSGGWFVNIDEMKTIYQDAYFNGMHFWEDHGREQEKHLKGEFLERYWHWQSHFKKWKARNMNGFNLPKTKGDDIHEPFIIQMAWLREAGFIQVDLYCKIHLWCIIGGKKPKGVRL
jgi:tRNA (cmo5U34)-methyltransferase